MYGYVTVGTDDRELIVSVADKCRRNSKMSETGGNGDASSLPDCTDAESDNDMEGCHKLSDKLSTLRINIEAEVAKHFRMGDEGRQQIEVVVENGVKEVLKPLDSLAKSLKKRNANQVTL